MHRSSPESFSEPDAVTDAIAAGVVAASVEVHRALGPGFLESVYERALCIELGFRGIQFVRQESLQLQYKGLLVGEARIDLLVEERVIVELKAVDKFAPLHLAQVISYLKATKLPLGLLINFNAPILLQGVKRVVLTSNSPWRSRRPGG